MVEKKRRGESADSADQPEGPPEVEELLSPEEEAMLAESWEDYQRGDYVTQDELRARLERRGA